jgi:hypothetical protein
MNEFLHLFAAALIGAFVGFLTIASRRRPPYGVTLLELVAVALGTTLPYFVIFRWTELSNSSWGAAIFVASVALVLTAATCWADRVRARRANSTPPPGGT